MTLAPDSSLFQCHKGPINIIGIRDVRHYRQRFNSIKVRLIWHDQRASKQKFGSFNSIKVRLILVKRYGLTINNTFQFHKGSINIHLTTEEGEVPKWFQFHKGSINIFALFVCSKCRIRFQFHKGSINILLNSEYLPLSVVSIP